MRQILISTVAGLRRYADLPQREDLGCSASRLNRPQKLQQVSIDPIRMRGSEAMRQARIINLLRSLDELGRFLRRIVDWNNLIVLTVHDQSGHIEFLEVLGKVSLRKCFDAIEDVLEAALHAP